MAVRYEKEQNGEYAIVIDGWDKGIASDPYGGMNQLYQVNLETPGEISVGYPITLNVTSGGGSVLGQPIARSVRYFPTYVTQGTGTGVVRSYAILDANGLVWEATTITGTFTFLATGNSTTSSSNLDGLAYWLGYLFKFRNDKIDYWDGSTWHTAWQSINSGVKHFAYVATNNQLYFTNGNTLGRIFAAAPANFDPTNAATFDFNGAILALPVTDVGISLAEVGSGNSPQSTLLIGGAQNAIYPWDKISTSFALPIYVADSYIKNIVSVNQNAFIFPGNTAGRGRIYITNGSQADLYYKIPDYLFGIQDPYFIWGDAMFHRNNLIFGMVVANNSGSGYVFTDQLWALNLSTYTTTTGVALPEKSFRSISQLNSNGTDAANAQVLIACTNPNSAGFSYLATSNGGTTSWSIQNSSTTSGIGTTAAIITDLIPVGTILQKKTFSQLEYKLRSALKSGESITVSAIVDGVDLNTSFTFSPTQVAGVISGVAPINFQGAQWLQLNIRLTGNSATGGVRLREIRLR